MAAALFWLVPATEPWKLYLFAGAFGFAYGPCASLASPLIARLFGLTSHGLILGVTSLSLTTGAAIGPVLAGHIFDVTNSYQVAFLVSGAISAVGLLLAALVTPTRIS